MEALNEAVTEHTLEPETAGPPPRRARLPIRATLLLAVALLLLGAFVAGSGRALWEAARLGWLARAGRTTQGRVIAIQTEPGAGKGSPPRQAAIRYAADLPVGGGAVRRTGWIGLGGGPALSDGREGPSPARPGAGGPPVYRLGQPLPVRYAPWFGGVASHPWRPDPSGRVVTLLLSGGLVLLVSLLLGRRLLRWARECLHLLRHGAATVGTVTHKRTEAEDSVRYFLRYGYAPAPDSPREREEQVSADQWRLFQVGQPVTVLYDPDRPERAALYALLRH
jgi:hypothetical protein